MLTPTELEVLAGAAAGETSAGTAARMSRSEHTVKQHRKAVLQRLGARNMTQATAIAYERGILGGRVDPSALPATDGQRRAFFAKSSDLDMWHEVDRGSTAKRALVSASTRFKREISSVKDLSRDEISDVVDELQSELDRLRSRNVGDPAAAERGRKSVATSAR